LNFICCWINRYLSFLAILFSRFKLNWTIRRLFNTK